jgi:hypothetical protein
VIRFAKKIARNMMRPPLHCIYRIALFSFFAWCRLLFERGGGEKPFCQKQNCPPLLYTHKLQKPPPFSPLIREVGEIPPERGSINPLREANFFAAIIFHFSPPRLYTMTTTLLLWRLTCSPGPTSQDAKPRV